MKRDTSIVTVIFLRAYTEPGGKHRKAGEYARLPYEQANALALDGTVQIREPHEPKETKSI